MPSNLIHGFQPQQLFIHDDKDQVCFANLLPVELLVNIMQYCSIKDHYNIELTSRCFRDLSRNYSPVWEQAFVSLSGIVNSFAILKGVSERNVLYKEAYKNAMQISENVENGQWVTSSIGSEIARTAFISNDVLLIEKKDGTLCIYNPNNSELQFEIHPIAQELLNFVNGLQDVIKEAGEDDQRLWSLFNETRISHPLIDMCFAQIQSNHEGEPVTVSCRENINRLCDIVHSLFVKAESTDEEAQRKRYVSHWAVSEKWLAVGYRPTNEHDSSLVFFWDRESRQLTAVYDYHEPLHGVKLTGNIAHISTQIDDGKILLSSFEPKPLLKKACIDRQYQSFDCVEWDKTTLLGWTSQSIMWIDAKGVSLVNEKQEAKENEKQETIVGVYPASSHQKFAVLTEIQNNALQWRLKMMHVSSTSKGGTQAVTLTEEKWVDRTKTLSDQNGVQVFDLGVPDHWHFGYLWMGSDMGRLMVNSSNPDDFLSPYLLIEEERQNPDAVCIVMPWYEKLFIWQWGQKIQMLNFAVTSQEIVQAMLDYYKEQLTQQQGEPGIDQSTLLSLPQIPEASPHYIMGFQMTTLALFGKDARFGDLTLENKVQVIESYLSDTPTLKALKSDGTVEVEEPEAKRQKLNDAQ